MASLPRVPASFFGIVLGLAGMGQAWRQAHRVWGLPAAVGETLLALAALVWAVLVVLYAMKWIVARAEALAELQHPVQCCFIGLAGVATMLVGIAALPLSRELAAPLCGIGAAFAIGFGVWRTGQLWRGAREPGATTAVLYLPTVAGSYVTAVALAQLGHRDWAQLAFGAGLFSWLAIESVLIGRLYHATELPAPLRPTLGIQLAPPTVGLLALLSVTEGEPGLVAHMMLGYGILQALVLGRMLRWIGANGFAASFWGFSFGIAAIATAPIAMLARGDGGAIATLAPILFTLANLYLAIVVIATLRLLLLGRLLPPAAPTTPPSVPVAPAR